MNNFNSSESEEVFVVARYNDMVFEEYQVSNYGRVRSLKSGKPKLMKPSVNKRGYYYVDLRKDSKRYQRQVHRLVLCSFTELPENFEQMHVNHIDEDKSNNCLSNLNWLTPAENNAWGTHNERAAKAKSKECYQFDLQGNLIKSYPSVKEVAKKLGFNAGNISKCCNGKLKTAYDYVWRYSPNFELD